MIQTVMSALELFAKAALVDHKKVAVCKEKCSLVGAENCLKDAFSTDVRPVIRDWALSRGLPADPMDAFRQSGYLDRIAAERSQRNVSPDSSYA